MALAGVTVRVTDGDGTNSVEIDMLVTADAITEVPSGWLRLVQCRALQERSLRRALPVDRRWPSWCDRALYGTGFSGGCCCRGAPSCGRQEESGRRVRRDRA